MNTTKLRFANTYHLKQLRSVYSSHMSDEYKISLSARELDEAFAQFSGYQSPNALFASVDDNSDITHLSRIELFSVALDNQQDGYLVAFNSLKKNYAINMAASFSMSLKESKLNAKFASLLGYPDIAEAQNALLECWVNVQMYYLAMMVNLDFVKSQASSGDLVGFSIDQHARMKHQIPSSIRPTEDFAWKFAALVAGNNEAPDEVLYKLLCKADNYQEFYGTLSNFISDVGFTFTANDEDVRGGSHYYITPEAVYYHDVMTSSCAVRVRPFNRSVTRRDVEVVMNQTKYNWSDVQQRGYYDYSRLSEEVDGLELLDEGHGELVITYSQNFRGKLSITTSGESMQNMFYRHF
ncbi:hypothetical protein VCHA53O466_50155 [Vibrio chagasii]|nr:hypothetical protein VCHA53O466_50155 [Vibrio chagasii]